MFFNLPVSDQDITRSAEVAIVTAHRGDEGDAALFQKLDNYVNPKALSNALRTLSSAELRQVLDHYPSETIREAAKIFLDLRGFEGVAINQLGDSSEIYCEGPFNKADYGNE